MKLIDALFCDDIRHEINNKVSLMGLYNDCLILRADSNTEMKWPIPINLCALLRFKLETSEKNSAQFVFEYLLNDKALVKIDGNIDLNNYKQQIFTLALTGNGIPLEPGNLGFSIKIYDEKKIYLSEVKKIALKIIKE